MRVALAQINPIIGDLDGNLAKILQKVKEAREKGANVIVFPEMALLGYPPEDLLLLPHFIDAVAETLEKVIQASKGMSVIVGTVRKNPLKGEKHLFNSAAVIHNGQLLGFHDKMLLPDYDVFSERRYFEPATQISTWNLQGLKVGVTVCEDIWQHAGAVEYASYHRDPIAELKEQKPDILLNLSASPYYLQRHETRFKVTSKAAKTLQCPVFFCNQVGGNDSLIFDGRSHVMGLDGELQAIAKGFEEDLLVFDKASKVSLSSFPFSPLEGLRQALVLGIRDYFWKQGFKKACLGLSGGIDSAVVACLAVEALGKENVLGLIMPSRFSSSESLEDAKKLADRLGIKTKEISIEQPFEAFLQLLEPHFEGKKVDHTEENLQSRIRGMILMAFSNKFGYIVLSTGNKSELAMGYCTLYGDLCGGLTVLSDVNKEYVYRLASQINHKEEIIPLRTIERPPSAELRPNQKDTDSLPEYAIIDAVLRDYVEEHQSPEKISEKNGIDFSLTSSLVDRIHLNEYKRRQTPPGLRVTKKAFSIGRRFPIVQRWNVKTTNK